MSKEKKKSKSSSSDKKSALISVIDPNKCIIEDFEILAFENEEQLQYYTLWQNALYLKKNSYLFRPSQVGSDTSVPSNNQSRTTNSRRRVRNVDKSTISSTIASGRSATSCELAHTSTALATSDSTPIRTSLVGSSSSSASKSSRNQRVSFSQERHSALPTPHNLSIFNPVNSTNRDVNTAKTVKLNLGKCKLSKVYKKLKCRQQRRDKVARLQIEEEISKSYLNCWQTYTALQALRLPDSLTRVINQPSTILAPTAKVTSMGQMLQSQQTNMPMQLFYIDPANLIHYSNRINPQQILEYRKNSDKLPTSANSKKSSAASYDAYEIMEVLVNSVKNNVVITRNAHRAPQNASSNNNNSSSIASTSSNNNSPAPQSSYYSQSVNSNHPGIVSTQLHLQAKSYQDSLRKFYLEDKDRVLKELEELKNEPSEEEMIAKYLYV